MLFVTVGTHEQQFNRLVKEIDDIKGSGVLGNEEIIMQTGYCTYKPTNCECKPFFSYSEIEEFVSQARIVICHGGPSSFIMPIQMRKIPIVVPRQSKFNEHINNHQCEFVKMVSERQKNIIAIYNINDLCEIIKNYENIVLQMNVEIVNNNQRFNDRIEEIIHEMM